MLESVLAFLEIEKYGGAVERIDMEIGEARFMEIEWQWHRSGNKGLFVPEHALDSLEKQKKNVELGYFVTGMGPTKFMAIGWHWLKSDSGREWLRSDNGKRFVLEHVWEF